MRVGRTLLNATIRLFSSSAQCSSAKQKVVKHVLRDYNITTTFRYSLLDEASPELQAYPWVTPADLQRLRVPPRRVKIVARDFIADSLYNPNYGYFSKQARIFSPSEPFDFRNMKDSLAYDRTVANAINDFEEQIEAEQNASIARQVFHTPTELFKPYYGEALARHVLHQYRAHYFPHTDLHIYEIGGGNGTLMVNILDYIRTYDPEVYSSTRYRIVEISPQLARRQRESLEKSKYGEEHGQRVEIIQRDILTWSVPVRQPSYVLAMEVIDNLPHDIIRYDPRTGQPLQAVVLIDENGEFEEAYTPSMDELPRRYLALRAKLGRSQLPFSHPQALPSVFRQIYHALPYTGRLTGREFIPTMLLSLLDVLSEYFPHHHLVLSDFDSLPNAIPGYMAPVVQTRYQRAMVPCTTYLVQQGYFDIFFPTNFEELRGIYGMLCPSYFGTRRMQVVSHRKFMETWGDLKETTTRSGENPMRDYYENVKMLVS